MDEYRAGLDGVIAAETTISYLDVDQESIVIRGYDLIELAERVTYLEVGYLLLHGTLPNTAQMEQLQHELADQAQLPEPVLAIVRILGAKMNLMDALRTGISALGAIQGDDGSLSSERVGSVLVGIWAKLPMLVAASYRIREGLPVLYPRPDLDFSANFLWMITGVEPSAFDHQVFDTLLTLYSEHEMPNSTFSARVIASTLSDPYGALTGAVASLKGPLHGGANEAVMRMLERVASPAAMESYLREQLEHKIRIMGFGHRVYMHRPDPRAVMMKAQLARMTAEQGDSKLLAMCEIGERIMQQEKGLYPNLDYYAAPVYHLLGVPTDLFTPIFFVARTVGLAAHIQEQYANNRLFRPRVQYHGARQLTV